MWFLNFIPTSWYQMFIHAITGGGLILCVLGALANRIPFINTYGYGMLFKAIGSIMFIAGVFCEGGYGTEMSWRLKLDLANQQIAELKIKSENVSQQTVTKYIERTKIVKQTTQAIQSQITTNNDGNCSISNHDIMLYNYAANNQVSIPAPGANEGTSDIRFSNLLGTTVQNYGTFYEVREQLIALQEWVKAQYALNH